MKRNESCSSLSNFVHYDFLQQKLKGLEDENRKLRLEVCMKTHGIICSMHADSSVQAVHTDVVSAGQ